MPGRVVTLKVDVGDAVNDGDALCVLEAMKMENEIVAPTAGIIKEVIVTEGASVSRGDPLLIIEEQV
ncbi:MAG: biotin/lipoyl-binding protein [Candidatus Bathyarchaeota archaeon]|nr:MAG: biotin/lipoyl-binding protein [Candidatus Bathyarchaeota archaeon]